MPEREVPLEAYAKAIEILNNLPIEKPWMAIHKAEDGTIRVTDSNGNSCSLSDWYQSKSLGTQNE